MQTSQKIVVADNLWFSPQITVTQDKAIMVTGNIIHSYVYLWDLGSNRVIRYGSFSSLCLWHADADEDVLVTFEVNWDLYPPEVKQTKWVLSSGKRLHWKCFRLSLGGRDVDKNYLHLTFQDWCHTDGDKKITRAFLQVDKRTTMHLTYDYSVDRLNIRWIECDVSITNLIQGPGTSPSPYIIYRWAQQFRGLAICNAATGTITVAPYRWDIRELRTHNQLNRVLPQLSHPDSWKHLRCFGDREVCGVFNKGGMQLWFFNPDFLPDVPDGEPFLAMEESG